MKKTLLPLLSFMMTAGAFFAPADAYASSHEKTVGIGGGFATYNHAGFGKLYFQYSFIPMVRIAPEIGYIFRHDNTTGFAASIDCHFPFRVARGFKFYPLVGFTYNAWSPVDEPHVNQGGVNIGGGFDLYFTQSLKLSIQGKYSAMRKCSGTYFDLGIGYVF